MRTKAVPVKKLSAWLPKGMKAKKWICKHEKKNALPPNTRFPPGNRKHS